MTNKLLKYFLPYTWYDIALYPATRTLRYDETAPRVSLMVKIYDAQSDTFRFYKILDTAYIYGSDGFVGWPTPPGHRPVAFLHDGEDLPRWSGKSDAPSTFVTEPIPFLASQEKG